MDFFMRGTVFRLRFPDGFGAGVLLPFGRFLRNTWPYHLRAGACCFRFHIMMARCNDMLRLLSPQLCRLRFIPAYFA